MIKPQLHALIDQNVPKMPIARPFFDVFASGVLIYASILTKLGQNVKASVIASIALNFHGLMSKNEI